jgi:putative endonuclease
VEAQRRYLLTGKTSNVVILSEERTASPSERSRRICSRREESIVDRYYVYILSSISRILYIGVTNDLERRLYQHRSGTGSKFASKYNVAQLVYFEDFSSITDAIAREKQLKGWVRRKKVALIEAANPEWEDLAARV